MGECDARLQEKVAQEPSLEILKRCVDVVLKDMVLV